MLSSWVAITMSHQTNIFQSGSDENGSGQGRRSISKDYSGKIVQEIGNEESTGWQVVLFVVAARLSVLAA